MTNISISALRLLAAGAAFATSMALPAAAGTLPSPYVSRALDAVLIPVDDSVRAAFGLAPTDAGVMVLATAPGGVAEAAGLKAGDVVGQVYGQAVSDPITLDEIVYYWINKGTTDFGFDVWSGGNAVYYTTSITLESYSEVIDVTTVSTWSSYSYEGFSYEEYSTEYSEEIITSYESSETTIEESASSEEFSSQQTEETSNDDPAADADADGTPDVADTDDDNDGTADLADEDDNGDGADDDAGGDDAGGDDAGGDDAGGDDAGGDDAGGDDAGGDDAGGDDGE